MTTSIQHQTDAILLNIMRSIPSDRLITELPVVHYFAPGIYIRQVFMKAGSFIIGEVHRTAHLNNVMTGSARVLINGNVKEVKAPDTFSSDAGVRKALLILEDMVWQTIHPTDETDVEKLKEMLIEPSDTFEDMKAEINNNLERLLKCRWSQ